jgi:ABC-type multidrug transport system permease subunit
MAALCFLCVLQPQPEQIQQQVYHLFGQKRISTRASCYCRTELITYYEIIVGITSEHVNACNSQPRSIVCLQEIVNKPSFCYTQSIIYILNLLLCLILLFFVFCYICCRIYCILLTRAILYVYMNTIIFVKWWGLYMISLSYRI